MNESFWNFWWEIISSIFIFNSFWSLLDNLRLFLRNIKLFNFDNRNIIFILDGFPIILWKLTHTRLIVPKWKRIPRKLLGLFIIYLLILLFRNLNFFSKYLVLKFIKVSFSRRLLTLKVNYLKCKLLKKWITTLSISCF